MAYKLLSEFDKNNTSVNNNYKSFLHFGKAINNQVVSPFNASNPLTYSMFPTLGNQFQHGSSISTMLNTTYNPRTEAFISERCSKTWDGFCKAYYDINIDNYWPNSAVIDVVAYSKAQQFLRNNRPTVGEIMIRNACNRKFISFPYETPSKEQFDPNTANSPDITMYSNYINSPSFIIDLENIDIDKDEHINLLLEHPTPCFDVLIRLYLGFIRKEPTTEKINGTKLEKYFKENKTMMEIFLNENFQSIPSFNQNPSQPLKMATCSSKKRNI